MNSYVLGNGRISIRNNNNNSSNKSKKERFHVHSTRLFHSPKIFRWVILLFLLLLLLMLVIPTTASTKLLDDVVSQEQEGEYQHHHEKNQVDDGISNFATTTTTTTNSDVQEEDRSLETSPTTTLKVLVVLLQWTNHVNARPLIPASAIEELWNGIGAGPNYRGGSISNWTNINSHESVKLEAVVFNRWITTDNTEAYYANGQGGIYNNNAGTGPSDLGEALIPIMQAVDADGSIDFSEFDSNRDGYIDSMVVMHTGYDAGNGGVDCNDPSATSENRITSRAKFGGDAIDWESNLFRMKIGRYAILSSYLGICDFEIARIGVPIHEYLHTLGLVDLYDLINRQSESSVGGVGAFDIMASPYGQSGREAFPGHLSPWSKIKLGWITPTEITQDGTYDVLPSGLATQSEQTYYKISAPFYPTGEYLLIENRQPLFFDVQIWPPGGIVIYHIDENTPGTGNNDQGRPSGYPGQPGWPGNGDHYKVAVLQADGLYELEKGLNNGDANDFWKAGDSLGPGNGESVASSDGIYPNTDSYASGNIQVTGITIDNFVEKENGIWSFRVSGMGGGNSGDGNNGGGGPTGPTGNNNGSPSQSPGDSPSGNGGSSNATTNHYSIHVMMMIAMLVMVMRG